MSSSFSLNKIDKQGKIILIVSLVCSLIFFIIGISSGKEKATELYLNSQQLISVERGEGVEVEFEPSWDAYYYICIKNATCANVSGVYLTYYNPYNYDMDAPYDSVIKVELEGGDKYKFSLTSNAYSDIEIIIFDTCPNGYIEY